MAETLVIRIKTLQHGQPRAYADSIYSAEISVVREGVMRAGDSIPWWITEEEALELARKWHRSWVDDGEGDWASPRLTEVVAVGGKFPYQDPKDRVESNSVWRVTVTEAYTD